MCIRDSYLEEGSVVSVYLAVLIICWTAAGVITGLILCSVLGVDIGNALSDIACMGAYAGILFGPVSYTHLAARLSELLGQEVKFAADPEVVGPNAKAAVEAMKDGDIILLENTRYRACLLYTSWAST